MITDVFAEFGNGDPIKGEYILVNIAKQIKKARELHSKKEWQNMSSYDASKALLCEVYEVQNAIHNETDKRVTEELQDVITVAVRMINKEYSK